MLKRIAVEVYFIIGAALVILALIDILRNVQAGTMSGWAPAVELVVAIVFFVMAMVATEVRESQAAEAMYNDQAS